MNNKGYSLIELLLTITIMIPLVFSLIIIPANLLQDYKDYESLTDYTSEIKTIKGSVVTDLEGSFVSQVDDNNLQIGESLYTFSNNGLYRTKNGKELKLSNQSLNFAVNIEENKRTLVINGENTNLEFSIGNSSFEVRE